MSKSTYMKWMKESYLYEDEEELSYSREDGDTWKTSGGKFGAKYKGDIDYFDTEDSAKEFATSGKSDNGGGEEEKPKAEPKTTAISTTGGLGGDDEEKPSGGETPEAKEAESMKGITNAWHDEENFHAFKNEFRSLLDKLEKKYGKYKETGPSAEIQMMMYNVNFTSGSDEAFADAYKELSPEAKNI